MKLFNAREARTKATKNIEEKNKELIEEELEYVTKAINCAVANNELYTQMTGAICTENREILRENGYQVTIDDDLEGHWYTWISWKNS